MQLEDAYRELGVAPGANASDVKAAWRRLAARWHPDRNASAEAAALMQRVNRAYDRLRLALAEPPAAAGPVVHHRVRLTLEQAALGATRVLRGKRVLACAACAGGGMQAEPVRCPACEGAGTVRRGTWFGWIPTHDPCEACAGRGTVQPPCPACAGQGHTTQRYARSVRLPAGVRQGELLTVDAGGREAGGFDGTLELAVSLTPHPFFTVADDGTVHCTLPVHGFAWLAEAWVPVPTLAGLQQMRLRRGRHVYRLRGQGIPRAHDAPERADQVVTVVPAFPERPSARQQALLDELAALSSPDDAPATRAWDATLRAWAKARPA